MHMILRIICMACSLQHSWYKLLCRQALACTFAFPFAGSHIVVGVWSTQWLCLFEYVDRSACKLKQH
jgi:hypothetical protein